MSEKIERLLKLRRSLMQQKKMHLLKARAELRESDQRIHRLQTSMLQNKRTTGASMQSSDEWVQLELAGLDQRKEKERQAFAILESAALSLRKIEKIQEKIAEAKREHIRKQEQKVQDDWVQAHWSRVSKA